MIIDNPEAKEKLTRRLQRIEGQLRGVRSMLADERDCREIMQQLSAIHSAVQAASRVFLQEYATSCLSEMDRAILSGEKGDQHTQRARIVQDMINLLDKAP
jgi:DNA-binding FrmR family transcriptional regulator